MNDCVDCGEIYERVCLNCTNQDLSKEEILNIVRFVECKDDEIENFEETLKKI